MKQEHEGKSPVSRSWDENRGGAKSERCRNRKVDGWPGTTQKWRNEIQRTVKSF